MMGAGWLVRSFLCFACLSCSLRGAAAWIAPAAAPQWRVGLSRATFGLSMKQQAGGSGGGEASSNGKKRITLGPGLFAPDIQGGGPDKSANKGKQASVEVEDRGAGSLLASREKFSSIFKELDLDDNGKIDRSELALLAEALGGGVWGAARATTWLRSMDDDRDGLVTEEEVWTAYSAGSLTAAASSLGIDPPLLHKAGKDQAMSVYQMMDADADGTIDAQEFEDALNGMDITFPQEGRVGEIFGRLDSDKDGGISFEEFYAWYSSGVDFDEAAKGEAATLFAPDPNADERKVFVRGFPNNAGEEVAVRFFSRCGEVENVVMSNWTRASGQRGAGGRYVITFKDVTGVESALSMHRNRMGKRHLEVFRVNRGDREEVLKVDRKYHGALIGIKGQTVQRIQGETGCRIFFGNDTMILKGRAQERERAWDMAQEIMSYNTVDRHPVPAAFHGRLIGSGGAVKSAMEMESGAHIVYTPPPSPACCIYGTAESRARAWKLVKDRLWEFEHSCEETFSLDRKYHGTLIGKGSATVKAIEEESGARMRFEAGDGKTETSRGSVVIRGTPEQCRRAWELSLVMLTELPLLLSELREEDIALGSLRSLPLSPDQVWGAAVAKALEIAVEKVPRNERSDAEQEPIEYVDLDSATTYLML